MQGILFRAKGIEENDKNHWYYGNYLCLHDTTYCFADEKSELENTHHYIVFEEMTDWGLPNKHLKADIDINTLGQYTGLIDKNGEKIFDGDIIIYGFAPCVVKWDNINACFSLYKNGKTQISGFNVNTMKLLEKIGNIYDNPELLKEE